VLVAAGEVRVGEVDVAKLIRELIVHLHKIQPARPDVARVERDVADAEQVFGEMAATIAPNAESVLRSASWHVLDGDADALPSGALERSGRPARERPFRRRRVDDDQGSPNPASQPGASHESLFGVQPPDTPV
jgi:hypothetical protein